MLTYKIGFQVDTKTLKSQLAPIRSELDRLTAIRPTVETKNLQNSLGILSATLSKSMTSIGTSSLSLKLNLAAAGHSVSSMSAALQQSRPALNLFLQTFASARKEIISLGPKIKEIQRVMAQSFKYQGAAQIFQFLQSQIAATITYVQDLDAAFHSIQLVTGKTSEEMAVLSDNLLAGAKAISTTAKAYSEAALIFYQQGLADQDISIRTDIVTKAAAAAGETTEQMASELTAIWNTYQMGSQELQRAASIGATLGAKSAVNFKYLAEAMQPVASAAAQMGVEYETLASIIATVGETTQQSASTVGNAFKTIFSRFQQLKVEGTDGEITLNRVSSQLQQLGINILDSANHLIPLENIINNVGAAWQSYTKEQQLAIAEIVGGTRQYGQFLALMNDFPRMEELRNAALQETGQTLEDQYGVTLDSISTKLKLMGEAWQSALAPLVGSGAQKTLISFGTELGGIVGMLVKGLGGLPGILSVAGAVLAQNLIPRAMQLVTTLKTANQPIVVPSNLDEYDKKRFLAAVNIRKKNDEIDAQLQKATGAQKVILELKREQNLATLKNLDAELETSRQLDQQIVKMGQQKQLNEKRATRANNPFPDGTPQFQNPTYDTMFDATRSKVSAAKLTTSMMFENRDLQAGFKADPEATKVLLQQEAALKKVMASLNKTGDAWKNSFVHHLNNFLSITPKVNKTLDDAAQRLKKVSIATPDLEIKKLIQQYGKLGEEGKKLSQKDLLKSLKDLKKSFEETRDATSETSEEFDRAAESIELLDDAIISLNSNTVDVDETLGEIVSGLDSINETDNTETLTEIEDLIQNILGAGTASEELADTHAVTTTEMVQGLSAVATTATSLIAVFQGIASEFSENPFKAVVSGLLGIATYAPMVISSLGSMQLLYTGLSQAVTGYTAVQQFSNGVITAQTFLQKLQAMGLDEETIKTHLLAAAKQANVVVTGQETAAELADAVATAGVNVAKKSLTKTILANTVACLTNPIILIIMGALALGGLIAFIRYLGGANERLREQAEELAKASKEARQKTAQDKEQAKAIQDTIKELEELNKERKKTIEGEQEFQKKVNEVIQTLRMQGVEFDENALRLSLMAGQFSSLNEVLDQYILASLTATKATISQEMATRRLLAASSELAADRERDKDLDVKKEILSVDQEDENAQTIQKYISRNISFLSSEELSEYSEALTKYSTTQSAFNNLAKKVQAYANDLIETLAPLEEELNTIDGQIKGYEDGLGELERTDSYVEFTKIKSEKGTEDTQSFINGTTKQKVLDSITGQRQQYEEVVAELLDKYGQGFVEGLNLTSIFTGDVDPDIITEAVRQIYSIGSEAAQREAARIRAEDLFSLTSLSFGELSGEDMQKIQETLNYTDQQMTEFLSKSSAEQSNIIGMAYQEAADGYTSLVDESTVKLDNLANAGLGSISFRAQKAVESLRLLQKQNEYSAQIKNLKLFEEEIENLQGDSKKALKALAELQEFLAAGGMFGELTSESNIEVLEDIIIEMTRLEQGISDFDQSWVTALTDAKIDSLELLDTIAAAKASLGNMLNLDAVEMEKLPETFIRNSQTLDLMAKAANGSKDALLELEKLAQRELLIEAGFEGEKLKKGIESINDLLDETYTLTVGAEVDKNKVYEVIKFLSTEVGATADSIAAKLTGMNISLDENGFELIKKQLQYIQMQAIVLDPQTDRVRKKAAEYAMQGLEPEIRKLIKATTAKVVTPHYKKPLDTNESGPPPVELTRFEGSREDILGKQADKIEKFEDKIIPRYEDELAAIEKLVEAYEDLDAAKDKAYGLAQLKLIGESTLSLQDALILGNKLVEQTTTDMSDDIATFIENAKTVYGFTPEVNEQGTITNTEAFQTAKQEKRKEAFDSNQTLINDINKKARESIASANAVFSSDWQWVDLNSNSVVDYQKKQLLAHLEEQDAKDREKLAREYSGQELKDRLAILDVATATTKQDIAAIETNGDAYKIAKQFHDQEIKDITEAADLSKKAADDSYAAWQEREEIVDKAEGKLNESAETRKKQVEQQIELLDQWIGAKIEEARIISDLKLQLSDFDLQVFQLGLRKFAQVAERVSNRLQGIAKTWETVSFQVKEQKTVIDRLFEMKDNLSEDSPHRAWFEEKFGKEAFDKFIKGGTPKEIMDTLNEYKESLLNQENTLLDSFEQIWQEYSAVLQEFSSRFDRVNSQIEQNVTMLQDFLSIFKSSGIQYSDPKTELSLMKNQAETAGKSLDALKSKWESFQVTADRAAQEYQKSIQRGDEEIVIDGYRRAAEEAEDIAREAHSSFISGIASYLDTLAQLEADNAAIIYRIWSSNLKALFSDLDYAMQLYGMKKGIDEYFMTDVNKGYNLQKLGSQVSIDLENAKKKLFRNTDEEKMYENFLAKVNARLKDGVKLTQTQYDILVKEYELEKAKFALKELERKQAESKTSMRLARDSSGNYSYIYSGDDDSAKIEEARQKIRDLENDIYNLHRNAADAGAEAWLQLQTEYAAYMASVDQLRYQHDLEYKQQVDTTIQYYKEQSALYAITVEEHNAAIGRSFTDTSLGVIVDIDTMAQAEAFYKQQHIALKDQLIANHLEWQGIAAETTSRVGIDYTNLARQIKSQSESIMSDNDRIMSNLKDLEGTARTTVDNMIGYVNNLVSQWQIQMRDLRQDIEATIAKIHELQSASVGYSGTGVGYDKDTDYSASIGSMIEGERTNQGFDSSKEALDYIKNNPELNKQYSHLMDQRQQKINDDPETYGHYASNLEIEKMFAGGNFGWDSDMNSFVYWSDTKKKRIPIADISTWDGKRYAEGGLVTYPQIAKIGESGNELVLNPEDTQNMLQTIAYVRDLKLNNSIPQYAVQGGGNPITINASFPNVSARQEIEAAFSNLLNRSLQYNLNSNISY